MRSLLGGIITIGALALCAPVFAGVFSSQKCQAVSFKYAGIIAKPFPKKEMYFAEFNIANKSNESLAIFINKAWGVTLVYARSVELQEQVENKWIDQPDLVEVNPPDKKISIAPGEAWSFSYPFDTPVRNSWHNRTFRLRVISTNGCSFASDPFSP